MTRQLYDLAGADDALRFSPYCWRAKLALKHKGLDVETIPLRFTEKDRIAESGQDRVPVLVDNGTWISDSWAIAGYLDETYPDAPPLFPDAGTYAMARFMNAWADATLNPAILPLAVTHVHAAAHEKDKAYFRESREQRLGCTLEAFCADKEAARSGLNAALAPLEQHLSASDYVSGAAPAYADYIVQGSLQWLNAVHGDPCLDALPKTGAWFARMGDLFDGYVRQAPRAA
ncbi:MAG: glutathione S-transferase family protein [Methyloligellaceae bacterium]